MGQSTLLQLAERLEAAAADEQRALIWEAGVALRLAGDRMKYMLQAEAYESAAMMLVPEGWHVTHSGEGRFLTRGRFIATVETWDTVKAEDETEIHTTPNRRHGVSQTFALALGAAALRARNQEKVG